MSKGIPGRRVDLVAWQTRHAVLLPDKPHGCNPVEYLQPSDMEAGIGGPMRRHLCARESECLTYARLMDWLGMSCGKCKVRQEYRQGGDEDRDDWAAIALLIEAAK